MVKMTRVTVSLVVLLLGSFVVACVTGLMGLSKISGSSLFVAVAVWLVLFLISHTRNRYTVGDVE